MRRLFTFLGTFFSVRKVLFRNLAEETDLLRERTIVRIDPPTRHLPGGWLYIKAKLKGAKNLIVQEKFELGFQSVVHEMPQIFVSHLHTDGRKAARLVKVMGIPERIWISLPRVSERQIESVSIRPVAKPLAAFLLVISHSFQLLVDPKRRAEMLPRFRHWVGKLGYRGVESFIRQEFIHPAICYNAYTEYIGQPYSRLTMQDHAAIRKRIQSHHSSHKISIVMPTYNSPISWLKEAISSVENQLYPHWELCISDDCSTSKATLDELQTYSTRDPRIKIVFRSQNGGIVAASNSAIDLATGEFIAFLDHDDKLSKDALFWIAEELEHFAESDLIYTDEDKFNDQGDHFEPHFKPDWNQELLHSMNVVTHLAVFRSNLIKQVGGLRAGFDGGQDYDLVLRIAGLTSPERIRHIPRLLYHWRAGDGSVARSPTAKPYAHLAGRRAVQEWLHRRQINANVVPGYGCYNRVVYAVPNPLPLVSAIICTRDRVELLKGIIDGLLVKTDYSPLEILIINNRSEKPQTLSYFQSLSNYKNVRVLDFNQAFNFSAMNNLGSRHALGEHLLLLNNDLEVIHKEWLTEMVRICVLKDVGVVGGKLYFPNDRIQHAGVILGIGGVAGHSHKGLPRHLAGYMSRTMLTQEMSAVTGACLLTKKRIFETVGGLDEVNLAVAFNDIDYCLKVRKLGYRVVWTPHAELYHLESASRGSDNTPENRPRFDREVEYMKKKWGRILANDPYYNPNLTIVSEGFSFAYPPRVKRASELFQS